MSSTTTSRARARRLLHVMGASAAAIAAGLAVPAYAQCAPNPPVQNQITTCTGVEADGLTLAPGPNFFGTRVIIETGAEVTPGSGDPGAITVEEHPLYGPNITNSGTVRSPSGVAFAGSGRPGLAVLSNLENTTSGVIAGATGAVMVGVQSLTNAGLIDGGTGSAYAYTVAPVDISLISYSILTNTGTIRSNSSAATVTGSVAPAVTNSGRIENLGTGLVLEATGTGPLQLTNAATGVISTAGEVALQGVTQAVVTNAGEITGSVIGGSGGMFTVSGDRIDNARGQINGDVRLNAGDDYLLARMGADTLIDGITGVIDGGDGVDVLDLSVNEDRTLSAVPVLPTGFEKYAFFIREDATLTLAITPPAGGFAVRGSGTVEIGIDMTTTGPVLITSTANFGIDPLNLTNSHAITTTLASPQDAAIRLSWVDRGTNSGTITAIGGDGVVLDYSNGTDRVFTNSGTITATGTAVSTSMRAFVNTGTVRSTTGVAVNNQLLGGTVREFTSSNSGTIEGVTTGYSLGMLVLDNSGSISASNGVGLQMSSATLNNLAGGVISGTTAAIRGDDFLGNYVTNAGTINGNVDFSSTNSPYSNPADWFIDRGGVVNGSVLLGTGSDVFMAELTNPSGGVTGTIDGGAGFDTYFYTTSVDASATIASPPASSFEAVGFGVFEGAYLTLTASAPLGTPLSVTGSGTIDLTADIANSTGLIRVVQIPTVPYGTVPGSATEADLTVISRGTLSVNLPTGEYPPYNGYVVGNPAHSTFENAGTINATLAVPNGQTVGIIQSWNEVINSGAITLDGATAVTQAGRLVNSGTITQTGTATSHGVNALAIDNSGTISVGGIATQLVGGGLLTNSGTIRSTGSYAVESMYGTTVENLAGGLIKGPIAIASQGGLVLNSGAIEGSVRLDYTPWGGFGTGYGSAAYIAAGGTVDGNVVFGGNSDLFLQVGESTGVSGVIDGGDSIDAFGRVYTQNATVDLAAPVGGVNFETHMVFASGADTTVTLTSATPYLENPWIGGDGRIVNQATVGSIIGHPPSFTLQQPSELEFELDATLTEFRNEGKILDGFSGSAASFVNLGQIGDGGIDDLGVSLGAYEDLRFENRGTILTSGGEEGVEIWTETAADITAFNSGSITGNFSIEISAFEPDETAAIVLDNSGSITTSDDDTEAVYLSYYDVDGSVAVTNSGTISAAGVSSDALVLDLGGYGDQEVAYAIINSGTIESMGPGAEYSYGLPYFNPPFTVTVPSAAIWVRGSEDTAGTIVNTGTIKVNDLPGMLSTAISVVGHGLDLTNAGLINGPAGTTMRENDLVAQLQGTRYLAGAVQTFFDSEDVIRNSGTIVGSIDLGGGNDRIENSGLLQGTTYLGLGDDTLTLGAGSVIDGLVDGGEGTDAILVLASGDGSVVADTLTGFESLNQSGTGTIAYLGTFGIYTIGLAGSNLRVDAGATLATAGTTSVTGTAGNETVTVAGTLAGAVALGDGSDRFSEIGAGRATGAVDGGEGQDLYALTLSGDRAGVSNVSGFEELAVGGSGTLTLDQSFELVSLGGTNLIMGTGGGAGAVQGSAAAERVTSAGDLARVALGGGDDTLSLGATVLGGNYLGEAGSDTLALTAAGAVRLDGTLSGFEQIVSTSGALSVAGTLGAAGETASLGDGAQALRLLAGGRLLGTVDLGAGDDQLRLEGGTLGGRVEGGAGSDVATIAIAGDTTLGAVLGGFEQLRTEGSGTLSLSGGAFQFARVDSATDLRIAAGASLTATQVAFGARDDRMTIEGGFSGSIAGGAGSDTLTVSGGTATAPVQFGSISEFEAFAMTGGYATLSGQAQFGTLTMTGGRFIGLAGSTLAATTIAVSPGATFGSAGTVNAGLAIASGAVFSPGASPAVMTVNGNVSLAGGSNTLFEFVPAPGQSDQLLVNGNLTIASGAILNLTGNRPLTPGVAYDMIVANSITGQFTIGTWDRNAVQGFLRYLDGASQDRLQLLGTFVSLDPLPGAAGAAVTYVNDLLISGGASSALLDSVNTLLGSNGFASAQAFGLLSPEVYASAMQLGTENGLAIAKAGRSGVMDGAGERAALFTFGTGTGAWRTLDAVAATGASGAKNTVYEVLGGIGYGNAQASLSGFVGYLDGEQRISALGATTDADGMVAGVSGHVALGGLQLHALVSYDWSSADTARAVPGAAKVSSGYDLNSLVLDAVASYDAPLGQGLVITPAVGLTHIATDRDATRETGSAAFALDVDGDSHAATFIDGAIALRGPATSSIRPWAELGVRHQLDGELPLASAGFVGTAARFVVPGVSREDTVITYGAGFEATLASNVDLFAGYHGESGNGSGSNLTGGLRVRF